jgi:hypothetical protein
MKYTWYSQPNFYEPHEIRDIIATVRNAKTTEWDDIPGDNKNVATEVFINNQQVEEKLKKLFQHVKTWNRQWFGYELYPDIPPGGNINVYSGKTNSYGYHSDRTDLGMSSDSKLTAILNVSQNKYIGGEFEIFEGYDHHIESLDHPGTLIVFPSYWYHRVKPVLSGERTTISFWFLGPNWK